MKGENSKRGVYEKNGVCVFSNDDGLFFCWM